MTAVPQKGVARGSQAKAAKASFNKRLSGRKQERTIVMIVTPDSDAEQLRTKLYHYLEEMRKRRSYG